MKILYGARTARLDLLRAVSHLACFFTKWTSSCDSKLHRLVCYIHSSYHVRMMGWVGDSLERLEPHLFADADFAGCVSTQRSTSGLFLCIRGPNSCFPVAGVSKRQGCVAFSTPEAETVAMNFALRQNGLPCLILWEKLLPHCSGLHVHEDNQAMMRVVTTGKNPTMRYISRTHGISVAWLHEVFKKEDITLAYELSARMCADIFTKGFTDADKWKLACSLICVIDPADLREHARTTAEVVADPDGLNVPAKDKSKGKEMASTVSDATDGAAKRRTGGHATAGAHAATTTPSTSTPNNTTTTHTNIHTRNTGVPGHTTADADLCAGDNRDGGDVDGSIGKNLCGSGDDTVAAEENHASSSSSRDGFRSSSSFHILPQDVRRR